MSERDSSLAEIQEHRAKIDEIDQQIVALLNKRAGHRWSSAVSSRSHLGLYDAKREEEIFAKVSSYNEAFVQRESARDLLGHSQDHEGDPVRMSEAKIAPIPDLGTRTDEITIFAGPVPSSRSSSSTKWRNASRPRVAVDSRRRVQAPHESALVPVPGRGSPQDLRDAGQKYGLKTLTEVMDSAHCELVHSYVDGLQVGARNFQNFSLLKKIGQVTAESHKMVLYKRGFAGTIAEWLAATDYLTAEGNDNVVLCERGIRTFETATRFTLDIAAIPVIHKQSLCPVCIDVSHPAGQRDLVPALAYAAVAAGADSS
ncbi:MAG: chorismate mutase [Eggerthella lenta]